MARRIGPPFRKLDTIVYRWDAVPPPGAQGIPEIHGEIPGATTDNDCHPDVAGIIDRYARGRTAPDTTACPRRGRR